MLPAHYCRLDLYLRLPFCPGHRDGDYHWQSQDAIEAEVGCYLQELSGSQLGCRNGCDPCDTRYAAVSIATVPNDVYRTDCPATVLLVFALVPAAHRLKPTSINEIVHRVHLTTLKHGN